jgi:hypothetical protein
MDSYDFVVSTLQAMAPARLQEAIKFAKQDIMRFVCLATHLNTKPITADKQLFT